MIKDITFGQYFPSGSVIHRLDPRVKTVLAFAYIVFIFVASNPYSLAVFFLSAVLLVLLSKVPVLMFLKNIKAIWVVIALTTVLNAFYVSTGNVIFELWSLKVTDDGIFRAIYMSARIIILIVLSSMLTYTTTPTELTDALERLFSPLKYIGLQEAVHTIAMMLTIALRFIPLLIEETDKIMSAQKARGADLESGGLIDRVKALVPILVPLLLSSIRRAYDLAEAMESRCYVGLQGRKRMKQLKTSKRDYLAIAFSLAVFSAVIVTNIIF